MKIQISLSAIKMVDPRGRKPKYDMGDFGPTKVHIDVPSVGTHYLDVPFEQKDVAKARGAKFDGAKKKWYIPEGTHRYAQKFWEWIPGNKDEYGNLLLNVPFDQKDSAKDMGAKWNPVLKRWYVPKGLDIEPFRRWSK